VHGGKEPEEPHPPAPPIAGTRLKAAQFIDFIRQLVTNPSGAQAASAPFTNADPDEPFEVRLFAGSPRSGIQEEHR
jgi:hypothetical protein